MSSSERLKKYIANKKKLGKKRVSFFVDLKFWKYIKKNALKNNLNIEDYLKSCLDFK